MSNHFIKLIKLWYIFLPLHLRKRSDLVLFIDPVAIYTYF